MTKKFEVTYQFYELPGGCMYQSATVEATNLGMALHKGFQEIKTRPAIKGRRITTVKASAVEVKSSQ